MLIYFYSEWRMVFVVILVGMHQLQSAERLRPRDSEADKFVHEPDATERRAHLPRLPTSRKATALPSVQVAFGTRISCLLLSDRNNIIESPATHDGVIYGAKLTITTPLRGSCIMQERSGVPLSSFFLRCVIRSVTRSYVAVDTTCSP